MSLEMGKDDFLIFPLKNNFKVVFSTANNGVNFNKALEDGLKSLDNLRDYFKVNEVIFLNQVHGNQVKSYVGCEDVVNTDGDGIITNKKNVIIGVFTADCVPIIIVDEEKGAIAALHSGWKGTMSNIAEQGIKALMKTYGSDPKDMRVFIGPHNRVCCYEVSEELVEKFRNSEIFKGYEINEDRKLNLQKCIEVQLVNLGVRKENISGVDLCTYCSEETKLYSYRKKEESKGRLFSFVFANEED